MGAGVLAMASRVGAISDDWHLMHGDVMLVCFSHGVSAGALLEALRESCVCSNRLGVQ